jgi:S-formylglutathione hydrolase FrmB
MALITCRFFAESLGLATSIEVILPQRAASSPDPCPRFPVLYLLHGLSDDETIWRRRTSIERYVDALGLAVVMPAVGRSFYQDLPSGGRYWSYVCEELPERCAAFFPITTAREDTFACGFSMGGYGAFRLGLSRPNRYAAVASISGVTVLEKRCGPGADPALISLEERRAVFGPDLAIEGSDRDLRHLATLHANSDGPRVRLLQLCGTEDFLYEDNQIFRQHMAPLGLEWTYEESPGFHNWDYVDTAIQRVLHWLPLHR